MWDVAAGHHINAVKNLNANLLGHRQAKNVRVETRRLTAMRKKIGKRNFSPIIYDPIPKLERQFTGCKNNF